MHEIELEHLKKYLGKYADGFIESLSAPPKRAVRINRLKTSPEKVAAALSLTQKAAYSDDAYLISSDISGSHPYHCAGVFYMQEPSAMLAVEAAKPIIEKIVRTESYPLVLDMCAAPGGKSGQLAAILNGKGALVSNEIDFKRARVLCGNLERLGVRNCAVVSAPSEKIAETFGNIFDVVAVDAPCSGEGMLRKEAAAWENMNLKTMLSCAERQREILANAVRCLKEGGILVYSTCTLNETENENVVEDFVKSGELTPIECPHLKLVRKSERFAAYRALPQDGGGEGHFVCVLEKTAGGEKAVKLRSPFAEKFDVKKLSAVLSNLCKAPIFNDAFAYKDSVFLCPPFPDMRRLQIVGAGVNVASIKGNAVVPAHGFVAALRDGEPFAAIDLPYEIGVGAYLETGRALLEKYLCGEELEYDTPFSGFGVLCADSHPLGLVKSSGGVLKNHYPKGLRIR